MNDRTKYAMKTIIGIVELQYQVKAARITLERGKYLD
jgi:hypothetical protein